jgi:hypothetical protein
MPSSSTSSSNSTGASRHRIGIIRVGGKGSRGSGFGYASAPDDSFVTIPVWSGGRSSKQVDGKKLSPFVLGPVEADASNHDAPACKSFENFWQFSKVYAKTQKQKQKNWTQIAEQHAALSSGENEEPFPAYFRWRDRGFRSSQAIRRPNGTIAKGGKPLYTLYRGKRLGYIDARKQLYQPIYQRLARSTAEYGKLLRLMRDGQNVLLIEPDGPDVRSYPEGREMSEPLLAELIDDERHIYGHGFALASALLEDLKKNEGEKNEQQQQKEKKQ